MKVPTNFEQNEYAMALGDPDLIEQNLEEKCFKRDPQVLDYLGEHNDGEGTIHTIQQAAKAIVKRVEDWKKAARAEVGIVPLESSFNELEGAYCKYMHEEKELNFIATPEQMASQLVKQGFVDDYFFGVSDVIMVQYESEYNSERGGEHYQKTQKETIALTDFMEEFTASDWKMFLTAYEAGNTFQRRMKDVFKAAKEKYSKVGSHS